MEIQNENVGGTNTLETNVAYGGPSRHERKEAILAKRDWTVLNLHLIFERHAQLLNRTSFKNQANALKHCLQTFGPFENFFERRPNVGVHEVCHYHLKFTCSFVVEVAVIDMKNRVMAIIGCDPHENYPFQTRPLTAEQTERLLAMPSNIEIVRRTARANEQVSMKHKKLVNKGVVRNGISKEANNHRATDRAMNSPPATAAGSSSNSSRFFAGSKRSAIVKKNGMGKRVKARIASPVSRREFGW